MTGVDVPEKAESAKGDTDDVTVETMTLRRELGLSHGISFIVGSIVGSGIFVSPKGVLEATGSVGLTFLVWIGSGLISMMGALCYSELGTLIPKAGGEYAYIQSAFGDLPAFLYTWVSILLIRPSSLAIMSLTFGTYFTSLFDYCGEPELPQKFAALASLVSVLILNIYSTKMAANIQLMTTVAKVIALLIIIIGGFYKIANGTTKDLTSGFQGSTTDASVIALAFYDSLFAYDGWNNLNYVTEELQNPAKNLPRANIISTIMVIVVYLLTNISYLGVMTKQEMLDADAVAVLWGDRVLKSASMLIPLSVMVSTFGSSNGAAFSGGRSVFSAARDGNLPEVLGYINVKRMTPLPSMLFTLVVAMVFVLLGDVSSLIDFFSFTAWLFYGMTFASLLYFRVKRKDDVRPYKVPIAIPILMVMISCYLIIAPIIRDPAIEFLYAAIFVAGGAVFYFPFVHFKLRIPGIDKFTMFSQLVLELAPASKFID